MVRPSLFQAGTLKCWLFLMCCCFTLSHAAGLKTEPLKPLSVSDGSNTLFEWVPSSESGVSYQMNLPDVAQRFRELLQLATLGGIATGDVDGDGWADFFVASPLGGSRLYHNLGGFKFEDVTEKWGLNQAGFWASGVNMADINNDGRLDLYVCGYRMPNRLYLNIGPDSGGVTKFVESAKQYGLDYNGGSMQMFFADMDLDGDLDAYLATTAVPPPPGVKFQVRFEGNKPVVPDELKEYWSLIYLPGDKAHPSENGQYDHLFRNDGDKFTEVTKEAGIDGPYLTLGAIWWDFNQDRYPDLYVANDYLGPDMLYLNQGDGTFKDVIIDSIPHTPWSSMGVDIGDLDNNGWMDLIACDMMGSTHYRRQVMMGESSRKDWFLDFAEPRQYSRNTVYLNTGTGSFMEAASLTGMAATDWTWAPRMEDFDLDGRVDVLFTNGMLRDVQHSDLANYADHTLKGGTPEWADWWSKQGVRKEANFAFRNQGDLEFQNVSADWGLNHVGVTFGAATADFDHDGDLDLVLNNADGPLQLLRNQSVESNRVSIRLVGGQSNKHGVGASLFLEAGGLKQSRHIVSGRSWLSGSEPMAHFGLGNAAQVDKLTVRWPSGVVQTYANLQANQRHVIHEAGSSDASNEAATPWQPEPSWFHSSSLADALDYQAQDFDDFSMQPLLPHQPSKTHFAMAWGDLDGDGDQDAFIGAGLGHAGSIYLRQEDGAFKKSPLPTDMATQTCYDSDALFADADRDGDLDLFLVKCTPMPNPTANVPGITLYLNDGKGELSESPPQTFPPVLPVVGCLAAGDVDQDGDLDLYLGGGPVPGKYPVGSPGYLLINEGGKWNDQTPAAIKPFWLSKQAVWSDVDGDERVELLVATEWGSVKLIQKREDEWIDLTEQAGLSSLLGWWASIAAADLDGDGDTDFVLGNRGLNTAYQPGDSQPDWLIFGDMDQNARPELLEVYSESGVRFPRRGFDPLQRSMPFLRQKFLNFHQFSMTPLTSMFSEDAVRKAYLVRATQAASGVLLNKGDLKFEFNPLPKLAQAAPINDVVITDLNGDEVPDLVVAQNDFSPQRMHGRMDGGLGMVLLGRGDGSLDCVNADQSGVVVSGDMRRVESVDLDGDGKEDLVFGGRSGNLKALLRQ